MGIEPTLRAATARSNGFEDRESHQAPCASGPSLTPALSRSLRLAKEVRRDSRGGTSSGCWSLTWPGGGPQSPRAVARKEKPSGGEFTSPERGGFGGHFCGGEKGGEPQSARAAAREKKPSGGKFTSPERGGFGGHFCGGEKGGEPQSPPQ